MIELRKVVLVLLALILLGMMFAATYAPEFHQP